jgi:hypothetical protein
MSRRAVLAAKTLGEATALAKKTVKNLGTYAEMHALTFPGWVTEQIPPGVTIHDAIQGEHGEELRQRLVQRLIANWKRKREDEIYHQARFTIAKEIRSKLALAGIHCSLPEADRFLRQHIVRVVMVPELIMKEE